MSKNESIECVADIVESFDMSYHIGRALENMLLIEFATSKDEAEMLAKEAKGYIDRYVAFQWKGGKQA